MSWLIKPCPLYIMCSQICPYLPLREYVCGVSLFLVALISSSLAPFFSLVFFLERIGDLRIIKNGEWGGNARSWR